jgi:thymidylate kinase
LNRSLLIIEGPAGVGKTSIVNILKSKFTQLNIPAGIITEFSENNFGRLVEQNAAYGKPKPDWLKGLAGFFIFLSDKINSLNNIAANPGITWICDRFFDTQIVVGLNGIDKPQEREFAENITKSLASLYLDKLPANALFVFLKADLGTLIKRLELRIERPLNENEITELENEVAGYDAVKSSFYCRRILEVWNDGDMENTIQVILKNMNETIE